MLYRVPTTRNLVCSSASRAVTATGTHLLCAWNWVIAVEVDLLSPQDVLNLAGIGEIDRLNCTEHATRAHNPEAED
jgi:hypothetical protein